MAKLNLLSDPECKNAITKGKEIRKLHDGGGLYLWVYSDGRTYWRLRYVFAGSEKSISLGVYPAIGLKEGPQAPRRGAPTPGGQPGPGRRAPGQQGAKDGRVRKLV